MMILCSPVTFSRNSQISFHLYQRNIKKSIFLKAFVSYLALILILLVAKNIAVHQYQGEWTTL